MVLSQWVLVPQVRSLLFIYLLICLSCLNGSVCAATRTSRRLLRLTRDVRRAHETRVLDVGPPLDDSLKLTLFFGAKESTRTTTSATSWGWRRGLRTRSRRTRNGRRRLPREEDSCQTAKRCGWRASGDGSDSQMLRPCRFCAWWWRTMYDVRIHPYLEPSGIFFAYSEAVLY